MSLDIFMSTLARAFSYVLPIVGVIALIYLILFFKQLIETLKQVSKTAKEAFMNVVGALSENVQNAKDWFQSKKTGKESIETKEDE